MKKPVVDYRTFRLRRINEPQFSHLKYLMGWVVYFLFYFLTENLIPASACHVVHCRLDDLIPFCEWFVLPYVFWYFLIVATLLYLALYHPEGFRRFMTFIIVTQVIAVCIYIVYPTRQELRPSAFARDNLLTQLVGLLYAADTPTGVCPSMHVAFSIGIVSAWMKEPVSRRCKGFVLLAAALICLSTMFIKQHSALDFFAALPLCLLAEIVAYGRSFYLPRRKARTIPHP